jgi:hypothetical protein
MPEEELCGPLERRGVLGRWIDEGQGEYHGVAGQALQAVGQLFPVKVPQLNKLQPFPPCRLNVQNSLKTMLAFGHAEDPKHLRKKISSEAFHKLEGVTVGSHDQVGLLSSEYLCRSIRARVYWRVSSMARLVSRHSAWSIYRRPRALAAHDLGQSGVDDCRLFIGSPGGRRTGAAPAWPVPASPQPDPVRPPWLRPPRKASSRPAYKTGPSAGLSANFAKPVTFVQETSPQHSRARPRTFLITRLPPPLRPIAGPALTFPVMADFFSCILFDSCYYITRSRE